MRDRFYPKPNCAPEALYASYQPKVRAQAKKTQVAALNCPRAFSSTISQRAKLAPAAIAKSQHNESHISSKIADALSVEAPSMHK